MKTYLVPVRVDYDGTQIHSLWAYRSYGIQGDWLLAFQGGCEIPSATWSTSRTCGPSRGSRAR